VRSGEFEAADAASHALIADGRDFGSAARGTLTLAISLRTQARWRELGDLMLARLRGLGPADKAGERGARVQVWYAVALLESGRAGEAARLLDSLTASVPRDGEPGVLARSLTAWYALLAESAFRSGNAALTDRAADSAEAWAARAAKAREWGSATCARALALLAAHDTVGAMQAFQRAVYSPTLGWPLTNYHLGRLHLAQGDPRAAANILRPALQGTLDLVSFPDLHELIAQAYDRLGQRDSARVHWQWLATALEHSDSIAQPRRAAALARLSN
jgi:predicted Zn-dependent protease